MNTVLKKMMVALLALGIGQAAWADNVPDFKKTLQAAEQGVRQDDAQAEQWYRKAAEQGNAGAQLNLGVMYGKGHRVRQDYVQAVQWFRKAAEQGDAKAQLNLGVMYDNGQGVRQNYKIAKEWFGKACDNGLQLGCDAYRKLNQQGY